MQGRGSWMKIVPSIEHYLLLYAIPWTLWLWSTKVWGKMFGCLCFEILLQIGMWLLRLLLHTSNHNIKLTYLHNDVHGIYTYHVISITKKNSKHWRNVMKRYQELTCLTNLGNQTMEIIESRLICKNTKFQVGDAHLCSNPLVLQL